MTDASLKNLENAVEASLNEINTTPANRPAPVPMRQASDMDKLMATGTRLLREKTNEHLELVSSYERQRIELVDSYRVRIERLRIEAEDQLRNLETIHTEKLGALERLITKLKVLREA